MKVREAITVLVDSLASLNDLAFDAEVDLDIHLCLNPKKPVDGFDRLEWDFATSDKSPVVRGTWVTVHGIIGLIANGHSWDHIIYHHPEILEDDIKEAIKYYIVHMS